MLKRFGVAVTIFILTGLSLSDRGCAQSPAYTDEGIPEHTVAIPVPLGFVGATTGALHLEIPISTIPQRNGEPIVTKLIYDSTFYHYGCAQSAVWCAHGSSWRVISGSRRSGRTDYDDTQTGCFDSGFPIGHVDTYTNFRFIDIDGTAHVADNPSIYTRYFDCYSTSGSKDPNPGISAVSGTFSDRSGYTFQVTNFLKTRVWANDGTLVADGTGASCIPKDTNGNC